MTTTTAEKTCVVCKADLRAAKRVRDPRGRYYCKECYDGLLEQHRVSSDPATAALKSIGSMVGEPLRPSERGDVLLAVAAAQDHREAAVRSKAKGFSIWRALMIAAVAVAAAGVLLWFLGRPADEDSRRTLAAAMKTDEKNLEMVKRENEQEQEIVQRHLLAAKTEGDDPAPLAAFADAVTHRSKLSDEDAINQDPVAGPILRDAPELRVPVLKGDVDALWAVIRTLPADKVPGGSSGYLVQMSKALSQRRFASAAATNGSISGDVWLKRESGDVLPAVANEVLLLPAVIPVETGNIDFDLGRISIESRAKGPKKLPKDQEASVGLARKLLKIYKLGESGTINTEDLISVSLGMITLDSELCRIKAASDERDPVLSARVERDITQDNFWQLASTHAVASTSTDREGNYRFNGVPKGNYVVACRVDLPSLFAVAYWEQAVSVDGPEALTVSMSADKAHVVQY